MRELDILREDVTLGTRTRRLALVLMGVGAAALVLAGLLAALLEDGGARFYRSYLVGYAYFLSLALGALFFVLVSHLTRAGWSVALRRIAEVFAWTLIPLAALAVVILLGMHDLYEWTHAEVVAADPILQGKSAYLNTKFFIGRLVFYFVVWIAMVRYFLRRSTDQDESGRPRITQRMEVRAAPGIIAFALTVTFAAFDLLMSLYPHWYSTIWGVYYFSGSTVGFFSLLAIALTTLQRQGLLRRAVTTEHYHDVGKLLMAFVVFWAYIAFSQYMLIWYGNIPEETEWYLERQTGDWLYVSLALLFGHFVIPFLFLVSRYPKRRRNTLMVAAVWMLVMHWLDMFWLVMPETSHGHFRPGVFDLTCFVGIGGIFLGSAVAMLARYPLIPVKDPRLAESVMFENV